MAGTFTVIPQDTFSTIQVDAGVLLKTFDPTNPEVPDANIITATTGGITASCVPSFSDFGEDIDNCPNNTKELKRLEGWDCSFATTAVDTTPETLKLSLGAADIGSTGTGTGAVPKVTPRDELQQTDFSDAIWWVGDRTDGGFVAIKLMNALSTGGFSLRTTKRGKGQVGLTITGHVSINAQHIVPMEFYSTEGESA